jgi:hypothetical protein
MQRILYPFKPAPGAVFKAFPMLRINVKTLLQTVFGFSLAIVAFASTSFAEETRNLTVHEVCDGSENHYFEVELIGLNLLDKYPPEKYLYVGPGSSPAVLIAFFKAVLGDEAAISIPLSQMRTFQPGGTVDVHGEKRSTYTPQLVAKIRRLLEDFIPDEKTLAGRKLLFIDFAHTGRSMVNMLREVNTYLAENGRPLAEGYAYATESKTGNELMKHGIAYSYLGGNFGEKMRVSEFGNLAEYQPLSILDDVLYPETSSAREYTKPMKHKDWIASMMGPYPYDWPLTNDPHELRRRAGIVEGRRGFDELVIALRRKASRSRIARKRFANHKTQLTYETFSTRCARLLAAISPKLVNE